MTGSGDALYDDARLARFYDLENGWTRDLAACAGLCREAGSILDLGCGTGRLVRHLAERGQYAVGLDPAQPMLDIAGRGPSGEKARWIAADARMADLGQRFDFVTMTGHAFQGFLSAPDRLAVLHTVRRHLAPDGRFIFDSRNPIAQAWLAWTPDRSRRQFDDGELGRVEAWYDASVEAHSGIVRYDTCYLLASGEMRQATSRIAFPDRDEIANSVAQAGLRVTDWWGDWTGAPWHDLSPEIIVLGQRA